MPGVFCSGAIIFDTLVKPVDKLQWGTTTFVDSIEYHVGGNGANTSMALGTLGVPVCLAGAVGDDEQARFVRERLTRSGVDTALVHCVDAPTAATVVMIDARGNRCFHHRLGASAVAYSEAPDFTYAVEAGMSHYHFASLFILPWARVHGPKMLAAARAAGLTTSLDTNWDPHGIWMADLAPCLPDLDFLFMNEDEASMITGSSDPAVAAAVVLSKGVRTAVIKLSARGCAIYTSDCERLCPAYEVEVTDSTGAGDCFVAGFLSASLSGASLEKAGQFANAVGALSVRSIGAVSGLTSVSETRAWMQSAKRRTAWI